MSSCSGCSSQGGRQERAIGRGWWSQGSRLPEACSALVEASDQTHHGGSPLLRSALQPVQAPAVGLRELRGRAVGMSSSP